MRKLCRPVIAGILLISVSVPTHAITIDFESIVTNDYITTYSSNPLIIDGFSFENSYPTADAIQHWGLLHPFNADPGGVTYSHNYAATTTTLTQADGNAFTIQSVDIGDIYNNGTSQTFNFSATLEGGGTVSTTFVSDALSGLETVTLNWSGITHFYLPAGSGGFLQADNFVVNAIPVPTAAWLFGSGLLGLVGIARRKKA